MSSQEFKILALSFLSKEDAVLMDYISLNPVTAIANAAAEHEKAIKSCNFMMSWQEWEKVLRLNLVKYRMLKLKRDGVITEPPVFPHEAVVAASKAVDEHSPLDAEISLDKARWHAIDELAGKTYFHRNSVFAYYLKLLLLERRQAFNADNGFAEYKSLYASIAESAQNTLGEAK